MSRLHLHFLGAYQATLDDKPITSFRTDKIRALLAYLAVESERPHRRDSLAALLWPQMSDQKARYNLRLSLHRLRQTIGDAFLTVDGQTIWFKVDDCWLDTAVFTHHLYATETHFHTDPDRCSDCIVQLEMAISLYRGDFLQGFFLGGDLEFSHWATIKREWLHQAALGILHRLAEFHLADDSLPQARPYIHRQLELEPWCEEAHRQMMRLLAADGHRADALAQYETCRAIMAEELGVEPSEATETLYQKIVDDRATKWQGDKMTSVPGHLALPFIGRTAEILALDRLMADPDARLITIVGAGGMGKSRLALAVAHYQSTHHPSRFGDDVIFVPLAAVESVRLILPAISDALGFQPESIDPERPADRQLFDFLANKQCLLLLDNFEQLINDGDALEPLLRLLQAAPGLTLLVTSRERLGMQEEYLFPLEGLAVPGEDETEDVQSYAAVQLFLHSARRVQPNFGLLAEDHKRLTAICRLLEGMPLGIELAASWVNLLPLAQIETEIRGGLDFLTSDLRDIPERHRSIRTVFDASWHLLSPTEQEAFTRLSLFRDGFTRAAATYLLGDVSDRASALRLLSTLIHKSLLRYDASGDRYHLHELLRQYGVEKATQRPNWEACRQRHAVYFCRWLHRQEVHLKGRRQKRALSRIEIDLKNIRSAWHWAANNAQADLLTDAASSLGLFFLRRGRHQEGAAAFHAAIQSLESIVSPDSCASTLARLLYWQAMLESAAGRREQLLKRALSLLEGAAEPDNTTRSDRAAIWLALGMAERDQGDNAVAKQSYERSLTQYRMAGDQWGEANALLELGIQAWRRGDYGIAGRYFEQSLTLRRILEDVVGEAVSLEGLGGVALFSDQIENAVTFIRQSLDLYRQIGDRIGVARAQIKLSQITWRQKLEGLESFEESLIHLNELGTRRNVALWTVVFAMYKADVDIESATSKATEGLALCREIDYQRGVAIARGVLSQAALVEGDYDKALALAQQYLHMAEDLSLAIERSDAHIHAGWACLALDRIQEARRHVLAVLQTSDYWRTACLNLAAVLQARDAETEDEWAWVWRIIGYGERRYARHRSPVSRQIVARFLPSPVVAFSAVDIAAWKTQGSRWDETDMFAHLLAEFSA